MADIKSKAAKEILARMELHVMAVKENIVRQMKVSGYGAVLWSESVFGSSNYPLLTGNEGRTHNVHGLYLSDEGHVSAVIDYPANEDIVGVKTYTPQEAGKLFSPSALLSAGSPEEWDVIGDCFVTALTVLKAEKAEGQPLPWW